MKKKIRAVEDLEGILRQQFLNGFYNGRMPIEIIDVNDSPICTVFEDDNKRWAKTPYDMSYAKTRKLCSKEVWDKMDIAHQVELCDCWYALAVSEYLEPALDAGREFELA